MNEINTVKITTPGFKRTATGTCKSAKITVSGAPSLMGLNCKDKEYVDFIRDNESLLKDKDNPEEYEKMLAKNKVKVTIDNTVPSQFGLEVFGDALDEDSVS